MISLTHYSCLHISVVFCLVFVYVFLVYLSFHSCDDFIMDVVIDFDR